MFAQEWPEVPASQRPKKLYVNVILDDASRTELTAKGWNVIDTRLMPCGTDTERLEAVKATLEGIRTGSIEADKGIKDFLDLEMYIVGAKGKGTQTKETGDLGKGELDTLLDFGGARVSQDFKDKLESCTSKKTKKKKVKE